MQYISKLEDKTSELDKRVNGYQTFIYQHRVQLQFIIERIKLFLSKLFDLDKKTFDTFKNATKLCVK